MAAIIATVAVTAAGAVWELTALQVFAREAGGLRGMIANPRPLDYVNYDYTPKGHHYERWAFAVPACSTGLFFLLIGLGASFTLGSSRLRQVFSVWGVIVLCAVLFFAITAYQYIIAVNVFI